jgi:proline iminopeptidase
VPYPPIAPFETGHLPVTDGHVLYWEASGNPDGVPALYLHGGPGGGAGTGVRRLFDPSRYRIVVFDQRGCGRSRPLASDADADLSANTTPHLLDDIEALRRHLGVDRWTLLGFSWGTTLALAYALRHRDRVRAMVLGLVTTTSAADVRWITEDVGRLFPEAHARFRAHVPPHLRDRPLVDAYATLLQDPDPSVHVPAARAWCDWEDAHVSLTPGHQPNPQFEDPAFRLGFARLVTHYWRNAAFVDDLVEQAPRLDGIPAVLIHGRHDVSSPLDVPWRLNQRWSTSRLQVLEDGGHGGSSFPDAVVDAIASLPLA